MPQQRALHVSKRYSTTRPDEQFISEQYRMEVAERLSSSESSPISSPGRNVVKLSSSKAAQTLSRHCVDQSPTKRQQLLDQKATKASLVVSPVEQPVYINYGDFTHIGIDSREGHEILSQPRSSILKEALCCLLRGDTFETNGLDDEEVSLLQDAAARLEEVQRQMHLIQSLEADNKNLIESMTEMADAMLLNEQKIRSYHEMLESKISAQ